VAFVFGIWTGCDAGWPKPTWTSRLADLSADGVDLCRREFGSPEVVQRFLRVRSIFPNTLISLDYHVLEQLCE